MIDIPVTYSENCNQIVNSYILRERREGDHNYWDSDEVKAVRKEIKDYYKTKQKYTCSYCNQKIKVDHARTWDTEHIVSKATHPQFLFEPQNLCISCIDCNLSKSDSNVLINKNRKTYPRRSSDFLIVHPHFDNYEEHIQILEKGFFRAISPKGAFTIACCRLLRFGYEYADWDENISQKPKVLDMINKLLETKAGDKISLTITKSEDNYKMTMSYEINGEVNIIE